MALVVKAEQAGGARAASRPLEEVAEAKGLPLHFLEVALGWRDGEGGAVLMPYLDASGVPLFERARRTGKRRFDQPAGVKLRPYGLWRLASQPHGCLYLTEGETDAATLWHYALPALGLPGSNTAGCLQAEELERVHDLYLVPDNDEAGDAFVKGVAARLAALRFSGKVWRLRLPPSAKDVNHLHVKGEPPLLPALEAMVRAAEPVALPAPSGKSDPRQAVLTPRPAPTVHRMSELIGMDLPEPRWVVPGLLSEGLTILAGKPKLGKSWCALNIALTVAGGGMVLGNIKAQAADVLYLSLEDRLRRVQDRARKVLRGLGTGAPDRLHVAVEWPSQGDGGLDELERWLDDHPDTALVIIDVWQKFRPAGNNRTGAYEQDYAAVGALKAAADGRKVSCLLVHHCKKAKEEDAVSEISGTNGIAGAADGIIVMTRARSENEGQLYITGRDVEEQKLAVAFDPHTFVWTSLGDAEARVQSDLGKRIINLLRGAGPKSAYFPKEVHELLNLEGKEGHVRKALQRLAEKGVVERNGTRYRWPEDAAHAPVGGEWAL